MRSANTYRTVIYTKNGWNLARSIASDCVGIIESAKESDDTCTFIQEDLSCTVLTDQFARYDRTRNIWPFKNEQDMIEFLRSAVDISSDDVSTSEIARAISTRLSESDVYQHVSDPLNTKTATEDKDADTDNQTADEPSDSKSEHTDKKNDGTESSPDAPADSRTLSVDEINAQSDRTEDVNPSFGTDISDVTDSQRRVEGDGGTTHQRELNIETTQIAEEIAADLYSCFTDDQAGVSFSELDGQYDVQFPKRSSALLETMNSRGETAEDRIDDLAIWVQQWIDNPDVLERANEYSPDPMGSRPTS
jgi:hypothetical protein